MKKLLCVLTVLAFILWTFVLQANTAQLEFFATFASTMVTSASVIVTSVGVIIAWIGLNRVNESVRREIVGSLFTQNAHVRALIADTPRYRKYFFDKVQIARGTPDYDAVRTIAEIYLNYLEHLAIEQKALNKVEGTTWDRTIKDMLRRSPIMRETIKNNGRWYATELTDIATQIEQDMAEERKREEINRRVKRN